MADNLEPEGIGRREEKPSDETPDPGYNSAATCGGNAVTIETWLARRDHFRKAAPAISRPFPLKHFVCSAKIAHIYKDSIESRTFMTIRKFQLENAGVGLCRRFGPNKSSASGELNSLVIDTTTRDPQVMEAAAAEIYESFKMFGKITYRSIEVEARNNMLMNAKFLHPC